MVKTIEDLFHHPDFKTAAQDLVDTAAAAIKAAPEVTTAVAAGPVALLSDAVSAAYAVAHTNIVNKAMDEEKEK